MAGVIPDGVCVRFLAGSCPDKCVSMAALRDAADPLEELFSCIGATAARWVVQDKEARPLDGDALRALSDRNTVIHLVRRAAKRPADADEAAPSRGKNARVARDSAAGGAGAGGGAAGGALDEDVLYSPVHWHAPPTFKHIDCLGADFPLYNALFELSDNSMRSLLQRWAREGAAAPPLEIRFVLWPEPNGTWRSSIRDTGEGLDRDGMRTWAQLGSTEDGAPCVQEHANPGTPDGARRAFLCNHGRSEY
jgi:hypothetical protein